MRSAILVSAVIIGASICWAAGRPWPRPVPDWIAICIGLFLILFMVADLIDLRGTQ